MPFHKNVFVNCPFDSDYLLLLRPLLFTVHRHRAARSAEPAQHLAAGGEPVAVELLPDRRHAGG
jgi:hypothetical protein